MKIVRTSSGVTSPNFNSIANHTLRTNGRTIENDFIFRHLRAHRNRPTTAPFILRHLAFGTEQTSNA